MDIINKILIIENEPNRDLISISKLKNSFANVKLAKGIDAAENILNIGLKFNLIILDVMMEPDSFSLEETRNGLESGFRLYEKVIRNLDTIVIVWSGYENVNQLPWGDNVKEIINKSSNSEELVNTVKKYLK